VIAGLNGVEVMEHSDELIKKKNPRPFSTYVLIWLGLLMLTGITITVAGLNLGQWSIWGAIVIAATKSTLVVLYFMHIKYEDKVFKIMLTLAIFILLVILVLTFADVSYR
jgi:cytochrome c oxidase subunit IV